LFNESENILEMQESDFGFECELNFTSSEVFVSSLSFTNQQG